jgi:hypothetical protein
MNLSVCAEGEGPAPARSVDAAIAYLGNYSRKSQSPNEISIKASWGRYLSLPPAFLGCELFQQPLS